MNDKEATMMQPDKMSKDDVGLEIGEGYLMMGLKIDMPVDGRTIAMVHTVNLTPDRADELADKLRRYAEIARSIAPKPKVRILCMSCRKGYVDHADKLEVNVNVSVAEFARLRCALCGRDGSEVELVSMPAPPVVASLSSPTES